MKIKCGYCGREGDLAHIFRVIIKRKLRGFCSSFCARKMTGMFVNKNGFLGIDK